jgi:magnesium chelatase subunit I
MPPPSSAPDILPYCEIVGQENLRRALEISFVYPGVGGVLASGHRGTAKSTTVRSFARMATGRLPVTLPIGATEDRVLGGWQVEKLMTSQTEWQPGILEEAGCGDEPGMLYIDEVNLLDDRLTNIILDAASTGILVVQRDGAARETIKTRFSLVGTMNPEEGYLRPQFLDRFGLVVGVKSAYSATERKKILQTVLRFEEAEGDPRSDYLSSGYGRDQNWRDMLLAAREALPNVVVPDAIIGMASKIAAEFRTEGHRGELAMLRAARAAAAIDEVLSNEENWAGSIPAVTPEHLAQVAPLALVHRRPASDDGAMLAWSPEDDDELAKLTGVPPD